MFRVGPFDLIVVGVLIAILVLLRSKQRKATEATKPADRTVQFQASSEEVPQQVGQSEESHSPTERRIDEKFCFECGARIRAKAEICPKCGVRQMSPSAGLSGIAPNGKTKLAAALFALLLGGVGAHKFYLKRPGLGVLYLVFCWTFVPLLIGIIEGIQLLTMSDQAFNARYGNN
jgi:TM2 domain-containing membrane protein YozV/ribosomal protein L40E